MKEIAAEMGISVETVKTYAKCVYRKNGVHSALELTAALAANRAPLSGVPEAVALFHDAISASNLSEALFDSLTGCTGAEVASTWRAERVGPAVALKGCGRSCGHEILPHPVITGAMASGGWCVIPPGVRVNPSARLLGRYTDELIGIQLPDGVGADFVILRNPPLGLAKTDIADTVRLLARFVALEMKRFSAERHPAQSTNGPALYAHAG